MAAKQSTTVPADVHILGQLSDGISFIETVRAALRQDRYGRIAFVTPCLRKGIKMLRKVHATLDLGEGVRVVPGRVCRSGRARRKRKGGAQ